VTDPIKRTEATHIDEVRRTATSTVQWFAEMKNKRGAASHPITHNNRLTMFICGEAGFADIAKHIGEARESIDLCCWGFDPGMELQRGAGATWPRGETYGDLLIAAGKRGVKVRLLVWYDLLAVTGDNPRNMPGYTHGLFPWCRHERNRAAADKIGARHSVDTLAAYVHKPFTAKQLKAENIEPFSVARTPIHPRDVPGLAREEYCHSWYAAAVHGHLPNISLCVRKGQPKAAGASLDAHDKLFPDLELGGLERQGIELIATHHQKTVLIDFCHADGTKAVGYIMGLNSVTDYWDTEDHLLENTRREQGGATEAKEHEYGAKPDGGFRTLKPYRDYACRLDGGSALIEVNRNFIYAWYRETVNGGSVESDMARQALAVKEDIVPSALNRAPQAEDCSVQVIRTQPEEQDTTIRDIYFQATDIATMAAGYLYIENQYFQYEPWSRRLMQSREQVMERWKRGRAKAGKGMEDMPMMHVMIVIPCPERETMIPRTYDALAVLGQQGHMTKQTEMIEDANKTADSPQYDALGNPGGGHGAIDEVVAYANQIDKPSIETLEKTLRIKISVAMLNTCGFENGRWRYREIYIHSKLMLVDDTFMTIGSANLNIRSMAADSELNLATVNPPLVKARRQDIWNKLSGKSENPSEDSSNDIQSSFRNLSQLMNRNQTQKEGGKKITGFLLPLSDKRSSNMRLG